jgi:hypothetical protein
MGHEFQLSAEPSGQTLVKAKRHLKHNPKTWLIPSYNIEYLVGGEWKQAVIKAKWLVDFRSFEK